MTGLSSRTIAFGVSGCDAHRVHLPRPVLAELHHVFPKYLQARVGRVGVFDDERVALCPTGHTDVHAAIDAILAGRPIPRGVGRSELAIARTAIARYRAAGGA